VRDAGGQGECKEGRGVFHLNPIICLQGKYRVKP
jgi:hypothetical protein